MAHRFAERFSIMSIPISQYRRLAAGYLLLQGGATVFWWAFVLGAPSFRDLFFVTPRDTSMMVGFAVGDAVLFAGGSFLTAWLLLRRNRYALLFLWLTSGAVLYAELMTIGFAASSGHGWWGVILMAPAVVATIFLAIVLSRSRESE